MTAMQTPSDIRTGIRKGLPLVLPTLAGGITFGVLAQPVMGSVAPVVMSLDGLLGRGAVRGAHGPDGGRQRRGPRSPPAC